MLGSLLYSIVLLAYNLPSREWSVAFSEWIIIRHAYTKDVKEELEQKHNITAPTIEYPVENHFDY